MPKRSRFFAYLFVVSLAAWTVALLIPVPKTADRIGGAELKFIISKVLHATAYAYLTVVAAQMTLSIRQRWLILGLLSFHAFLTEFLQQFVNRGASLRDVGLDHFGILIGLLASRPRWRALWQNLPSNPRESNETIAR